MIIAATILKKSIVFFSKVVGLHRRVGQAFGPGQLSVTLDETSIHRFPAMIHLDVRLIG
ncbi:MAG: hypothetical protein HY912_12835 [Desulfomonile tiedjei]|uniref:Uncharacterized protein n=1 Tax=Desulfomonile tiedjei TaxID=2358 RepID=A0A9D6V1Z4_9BACT|nr:hypothetical protein [Desulfomonile tiedjei]